MHDRPDPDSLLVRIREDEQRKSRGRLEIFLGMCPGVGKTYAMLESAQEDRREGRRVLVGIVETHRREDTEALLAGFAVLPRRAAQHRGVTLDEFDLDAALRERPEALLVDELAHTNAPGSRHAKRWQDVRELIDAGINVKTTMNIQHVESLNDVVAQITGVRMRETVPDTILEKADEVILVDLPPDELIERLQAGNVYLGAQAERATQGFFKPANLAALRELALRFVASRVGIQVRLHREAAGASAIWPTQERLLVAVGPAPSSATLVRSAKRLSTMLGADWFALFVETPRVLSPENRERVSAHLQLAESLGAKTATVGANDIPEGILQFARRENITKIVLGKPVEARWKELLRPSPVDKLVRETRGIDLYLIKGDGTSTQVSPTLFPSLRPGTTSPRSYIIAFVATSAAIILGNILSSTLALPDIAMLFLLASVTVSFLGSRRATILTALLSALSFNFFFIPPIYTFSIALPQFVITFVMLFVVSLAISELTLRMRIGRDLARRIEARTAALYRLSSRLAEARGTSAIVRTACQELGLLFQTPVVITTNFEDVETAAAPAAMSEKENAVARWAFENRLPAGRGTTTLHSSECLHLPLLGPRGCVGVMSIGGALIGPDQLELLHALARHLALVLSIEEIDEQRRQSSREAEGERLRNSILSAVSHDIRTPLASILGSASSLLEQHGELSPVARRELLQTIFDEAGRLNRLIANLLEMTRLEDGNIRLNKVPIPVDEMVGTALNAMRGLLTAHPISTHIPPAIEFVNVDEQLIQHVLINILENVAKHTPEGTPIDVSTERNGDQVRLTISDRGPGLPMDSIPLLFDRYYQTDKAKGGVGLGLAICQSVVKLHGGTITAENRDGGGASFIVTLPIAPPSLLPTEQYESAIS